MKSFYTEAKQHLTNCARMLSVSSSTSSSPNDKHHELEREHEHGHEYHYDNGGVMTTTSIMGHDDCAGCGDDEDDAASTPPTIGLNNNFISTTTYDTLQRPFKYDKLRGRWSSAADFYFACTSHAFGSVVFSELALYVSMFAGGKSKDLSL